MSPQGRPKKDLTIMAEKLKAQFGTLRTKEEVAKASRFNAALVRGTLEEEAWNRYLNKQCGDRGRIWAEIMLYRRTGECSFYYVSKEESGGPLEDGTVDEMDVCGVAFSRLFAEGRLAKLVNLLES